ncbi:hypothetical protein [Rhizobium leguminosarum]|uniref:hypothetical protein n=1 Tax=Rhizobium leguminosarum TaxID=384 RepID=UPI001C96B41E|nr:hypothetical protein [Rhizobium leguminosarum]MBY5700177.1 RDD family protein [Rhizobium leguminosarum]
METIYYDLLKRNLETRRLITLSTLGLVTWFGVIVIGKVLEGQDLLNYYDSEFSGKAKLLVGAVAIGWMVFFMAYGMLTLSIRALISKAGIPKEQQVMVLGHSLGYSYLLPFLLSAALTAGIILPLEQQKRRRDHEILVWARHASDCHPCSFRAGRWVFQMPV